MAIAMYNGNEPYIFISYAHKDSDVVVPIIEALADNGFRVWYDAGIEVGSADYSEDIANRIKDSKVVVVFVSKKSMQSEFCLKEVKYASSKGIKMLLIYIEDVELSPGLELILGLSQALFYNRMPYEAFLQKLTEAAILAPCRRAGAAATPTQASKTTSTPPSQPVTKQKVPVTAPAAPAQKPTASPLSDFEIENGVLERYVGKSAKVVIPDGVTSIGSAFYECSSLTSITIPDSVISIGDLAFYGCSSLTSITIPDSVTSIGDLAFYECSSLTSITIPSSVTRIGEFAFEGCESLTICCEAPSKPDGWADDWNPDYRIVVWGRPMNDLAIENGLLRKYVGKTTSVVIPDGVTSIGEYAFYGCSSLMSITIPDGVTSIGEWAFYGCSRLTSITIPASVTSIGENAFNGCSRLTSITIPDSVTSIDMGAFEECTSLTSITIPDSVASIGEYAFYGCSSLTSITIPDSVTSIGDDAFSFCECLESITISNSVKRMGNGVFEDCVSMTRITIPNSVEKIGWDAFCGCKKLTIYCEAPSKPVGWADNWNPDNRPVVWGWKK